jgi:AcrR family transcriptional regulator
MGESNRRERILAAAERLFQHYGQKKTTMADIARDVGIGVGSLYLDFPSKDALLSELAAKRGRAVTEAMAAVPAGGTAPERVASMLEARVTALLRVAEEGTHACELVMCAKSTSAPAECHLPGGIAGFGDDVRAALAAEIERGRAAGEIECGPIGEVIDTLEIAFMALSPPFLFRYEPARAQAIARSLSRLVVHGLRPPRPAKD